ncbi:hypothetical protein [Bacteroides thetaiotaomicron]|uniref:hypothetical protein n=1 Tax=Bacteroides thetaiotaomicron TaxID=818 RepID=UPI001F4597B0|nr:hypothetical protein [Bacteroides thetaiotaomicron]MCE8949306.1 hypothetical protein [Bacteroides thetaiotaomicron]MCE8967560.1 hypothetical protein [Bacteroides thetaiotaomicron]
MIRTVAVFVFVSFACVATAFSQTIEKENKIDVQKKNSSTEVSGRQLPEAKNIEPKLPDIEVKKLATDDKSMQTYGLTPSSPASGLSPYFYDFPALLESNPTLTDFYNFRQYSMNGQLSFIGSAEQKTYLGLGQYVAVNAGMRWIPSQRFFVEAGGALSRQFYLALPIARQDIAGIYTRMHYSLARNVRLNVWGQYFMGGNTPPPAYNPLFPHTGVGASISVDVKKNTEVSVGAEYQYDKNSREWKMETSGRVSIGF